MAAYLDLSDAAGIAGLLQSGSLVHECASRQEAGSIVLGLQVVVMMVGRCSSE